MKTHTRRHAANRLRRPTLRAFSIIELLVVIVIMLIVAGLVFPTIASMQRGGREASGINTVSVAVAAARIFAGRPKADLAPDIENAEYSGGGLLFRNDRILYIENNQRIVNTATNRPLEEDDLNGYSKLLLNTGEEMEPVILPRGVGVVGLMREGGGGENNLRLVAPDFAILFNKHGQLVHGPDDEDAVYFDENDDGRASPADRAPTVYAVIVYSAYAFADAGQELSEINTANERRWLLENGEVVFFSPYTGTPIRERLAP